MRIALVVFSLGLFGCSSGENQNTYMYTLPESDPIQAHYVKGQQTFSADEGLKILAFCIQHPLGAVKGHRSPNDISPCSTALSNIENDCTINVGAPGSPSPDAETAMCKEVYRIERAEKEQDIRRGGDDSALHFCISHPLGTLSKMYNGSIPKPCLLVISDAEADCVVSPNQNPGRYVGTPYCEEVARLRRQ